VKKYAALFKSNLLNSLEYRGALLTWILVEIASLTSAIFLWTGAFRTNNFVGEYQFSSMILYYLLIPIVAGITNTFVSEVLPRKIKDGEISTELVKPISFTTITLINNMAIKITQFSIKIPVYFVVSFFLFRAFNLKIDPVNLIICFFVCLLAYLLHFFLDYALSLVSFWMEDTWSLSLLKLVCLFVFGGMSYPLDLAPAALRSIIWFLPFRFIFYFPISVAQGKFNTTSFVYDIISLLLWTIFFFLLGKFLWTRGVKKFSAYGQ